MESLEMVKSIITGYAQNECHRRVWHLLNEWDTVVGTFSSMFHFWWELAQQTYKLQCSTNCILVCAEHAVGAAMLMTDLEECGCLFALVAMKERERWGCVRTVCVCGGESIIDSIASIFDIPQDQFWGIFTSRMNAGWTHYSMDG